MAACPSHMTSGCSPDGFRLPATPPHHVGKVCDILHKVLRNTVAAGLHHSRTFHQVARADHSPSESPSLGPVVRASHLVNPARVGCVTNLGHRCGQSDQLRRPQRTGNPGAMRRAGAGVRERGLACAEHRSSADAGARVSINMLARRDQRVTATLRTRVDFAGIEPFIVACVFVLLSTTVALLPVTRSSADALRTAVRPSRFRSTVSV